MAYLARFSYDVLPANRQRALDLIRREVAAARRAGRDVPAPLPWTSATRRRRMGLWST